jgi:hypothetical protein
MKEKTEGTRKSGTGQPGQNNQDRTEQLDQNRMVRT